MHTDKLTIIGCGGHGRVVIDALKLNAHGYAVTLWDDNPQLLGKNIAGYQVETMRIPLSTLTGVVHVAIGSNIIREKIYRGLSQVDSLLTIVHPSAVISSAAELSSGIFVAAKAILAPGCHIGEGCIINHAAIIDHDVKVGSYSHIAPNSTLGGNVTIGHAVLIGAGAVVLPGIIIGDGAIVGAGAVVTHDVAENSVVKGIPAR